MYRHKWYGISVKGGRKKCMCTFKRLRTYIYIYVRMGTIRCKVEKGKFGKHSQMTSIHKKNTHLSEENTGRAIRGRSVSRSCCGTPIPSPNIPHILVPPIPSPPFLFMGQQVSSVHKGSHTSRLLHSL